MDKRVIVIGGTGGREHALSWKLAQSGQVGKVFIAPGNGGTQSVGVNVPINPEDKHGLVKFCQENSVDLAVIGPDDLLASGLADFLRENGINTFGPSKSAAKIESSKAFAKDLMAKNGVPTAKYKVFTEASEAIQYAKDQKYPLVVKASGLALGKGVIICDNFASAERAISQMMLEKAFKSAGDTIVIEEFLSGSEVSIHAISDGTAYTLFPASQDHKQIFDGDKGPNTGGMGAFAPVSWLSGGLMDIIEQKTVEPILKGLSAGNTNFAGCLYPGLMITAEGPKVIEYNARFGDPETQIYMRLLKSDLFDLLFACAAGSLKPESIKWSSDYAVSVVLASKGYPGNYEKGKIITGVEDAEKIDGIVVFHAGTKLGDENLVTSGGRVINVTATGKSLNEAIKKAYAAVGKIHFDGMHYRKDIGKRKVPSFA